MVGYKLEGEDQTVHLRLLASNPYMSGKDNYATAAVLEQDKGIDQGNYNWLYYEPPNSHNQASFENSTIKVSIAKIAVLAGKRGVLRITGFRSNRAGR